MATQELTATLDGRPSRVQMCMEGKRNFVGRDTCSATTTIIPPVALGGEAPTLGHDASSSSIGERLLRRIKTLQQVVYVSCPGLLVYTNSLMQGGFICHSVGKEIP